MLKLRDLYTYVFYPALKAEGGSTFGSGVVQLEVRLYNDLRNGGSARAFIVTCTERLMIPNRTPYSVGLGSGTFDDYPALLQSRVALKDDPSLDVRLIDYSPKTLNSSIQTDEVRSATDGTTSTQQSTTGSSTATTNTYGASASIGMSGDMPTASVSGSYEHSSTDSSYSDVMTGSSVSTDHQLSNSSGMTIKNWGSYVQLDDKCLSPSWVWGQEYPWNIIQFKDKDPNADAVRLPDFILARLHDANQAYPPSELSLFGINFVSKVSWLVTPPPLATGILINSDHNINFVGATHSFREGKFEAKISSTSKAYFNQPQDIDLELYALDPILPSDPPGSGVVGFVANKFIVRPADGKPFKIASDSNNLHVRGQGFAAPMTTAFAGDVPATMTVWFKIVDTDSDVTLYLKHWKTGAKACVLTVTINGTSIVRHVDTAEAEGGGSDVTSVPLRFKDFASIDYCDYIVLGLNTLTLEIKPSADGAAGAAGYAISALSIR